MYRILPPDFRLIFAWYLPDLPDLPGSAHIGYSHTRIGEHNIALILLTACSRIAALSFILANFLHNVHAYFSLDAIGQDTPADIPLDPRNLIYR